MSFSAIVFFDLRKIGICISQIISHRLTHPSFRSAIISISRSCFCFCWDSSTRSGNKKKKKIVLIISISRVTRFRVQFCFFFSPELFVSTRNQKEIIKRNKNSLIGRPIELRLKSLKNNEAIKVFTSPMMMTLQLVQGF